MMAELFSWLSTNPSNNIYTIKKQGSNESKHTLQQIFQAAEQGCEEVPRTGQVALVALQDDKQFKGSGSRPPAETEQLWWPVGRPSMA